MNKLERATFSQATEDKVSQLGLPATAISHLKGYWHHSFVLSDGTVVQGGKSKELLESEFEIILGPLDIKDQTVLDIGAWNGAFSFEAKRRGAKRVVSADMPVWNHEELRGLEKFLYVKKDSKLNVDYVICDVQETNYTNLGKFNIVLFLGVFYHLEDPLSCIKALAEMADPWLVLETHCDMHEFPFPAMRYYPGSELLGDGSNWWGPNPACIDALLRVAGFTDVTYSVHPDRPARGIFHAKKY